MYNILTLNNLILKDSANAKLGLGVISDVASVQNFKILDGFDSENKNKLIIEMGSNLNYAGMSSLDFRVR